VETVSETNGKLEAKSAFLLGHLRKCLLRSGNEPAFTEATARRGRSRVRTEGLRQFFEPQIDRFAQMDDALWFDVCSNIGNIGNIVECQWFSRQHSGNPATAGQQNATLSLSRTFLPVQDTPV
jgi:hypothetical protein